VVLSLVLVLPALLQPRLWWYVAGAFVVGWTFQFVGHAFERKRPEFLNDWRFLFVGLRWWLRETLGPR